MKKIVFVVLSFIISVNAYCQGKARCFYVRNLPKTANNGVFHVKSVNGSIGIIIGNKWCKILPVDKEKKSRLVYCRTFDCEKDTIDVFSHDFDTKFRLILTPLQKDSFRKNTQYLHQSHASHRSHYSSSL